MRAAQWTHHVSGNHCGNQEKEVRMYLDNVRCLILFWKVWFLPCVCIYRRAEKIPLLSGEVRTCLCGHLWMVVWNFQSKVWVRIIVHLLVLTEIAAAMTMFSQHLGNFLTGLSKDKAESWHNPQLSHFIYLWVFHISVTALWNGFICISTFSKHYWF